MSTPGLQVGCQGTTRFVTVVTRHYLTIDGRPDSRFVARCSCGWASTSKVTPSLARLVWDGHSNRVEAAAAMKASA
jgi:hypothetical protein